MPDFSETTGSRGVRVPRRVRDGRARCELVTIRASGKAIPALAGPDGETAVFQAISVSCRARSASGCGAKRDAAIAAAHDLETTG